MTLFGSILLVLILVLATLGLWYLGLRRDSLTAKQFAVVIAILAVVVIVHQLVPPWFGRPEYRSAAVGPTPREPATSTAIPVPVNDASVPYQLELRPNIRGGDPPNKPVHLKFVVRSPKGETIAVGEGDLAPAQRLRWQPLRAQFQPREEGEHTLTLEIPQPVSSVDVVVRELHQ